MKIKSEFFYSKSTGLYVARKPLKIDSRVKKVTEKNKIKITWNDEGRINFIDFNNAKKLLRTLGSSMMNPIEYWKVLSDAIKEKDNEMIEELTSDKYCEWLDRVYLREGRFIENPKVIGKYKYSGRKQKSVFPYGKPGWFNPENNIDYKTGLPKRVEIFRDKFSATWKYWFPDFTISYLKVLAPLRGYVTSVGKPSLDLGIPVDSRQPMQMVRECRKKPLETPIREEKINKAFSLLEGYKQLNKDLKTFKTKENYEKIYKNFNKYINFLIRCGKLLRKSKENLIYKLREDFFNLLGLLKIMAISKNENKKIKRIDETANMLSDIETKQLNYQDFLDFVASSKERLKDALNKRKDIVFVMGHKNPDTDTVISSLFEAWRNHLLDEGRIAYIPIIQNYKVPDEVKRLLGKICNNIILTMDEIYYKTKKSGLARWISVDQNREPEVQKYFISIIDHHIVCDIAKVQDLPKTLEMTGSCTALIVQKFLGIGLYFDKNLSRFLYGATLMDTENRVPHKMTPKDLFIMNYLKNISEISDDDKFYSDLMSNLLNTDDPDVLFSRDYKEDWGFGFSVAKVKNCFDEKGNVLKKNLIEKAVDLAKKNNINKNLPLSVLRITDYKEDNETVNRERVYLIFNKNSPDNFKIKIFEFMEKIVRFEFSRTKLRRTREFIEFWGTGMQLSRKKTAPTLEPVVKVFNEYFYSPTTKMWLKRDFLKRTKDVIKTAKKLKLKISTDKEDRINYVTYPEAISLTKELGFLILSLREYWLALNDAKKIKDIQMINSLQGSNFVEFLDTVIKDYKYLIEHPRIKKENNEYLFEGIKKKVFIPKGKPGLIHPDDIDLKTGIPKIVRNPDQYGIPELWRYWEPDSEVVIPTRSYIFLLNQPCWDGKFHIKDSFPNLGIRPCCKKVKLPIVNIILKPKKLEVIIKKEGNMINYFWIK